MDNWLIQFVLLPLCAYVIAATPFGVLLGRLKGVDIRKVGSGNIGSTNVGRVLGRRWGYLCFALDVSKGLLPVLAAGLLLGTVQAPSQVAANPPSLLAQGSWLAVACAAILGHVLPFWLKFRGGKGVATALGVVVGFFPYFTFAGLTAFGIWIVVTLISRYVSLGSIVAAVLFVPLLVVYSWRFGWPLDGLWPLGAFAAAMVALIIVRHRSNIRRLLDGTENKIGPKAPAGAQ